MTEEKKFLPTKYYLNVELVKVVYNVFFIRFKEFGEPIPHWDYVNKESIKHLVTIPKTAVFGHNLYPSIEDKAAAIFYHINKGHIFPNGNKRLSIACAVVFLGINEYELTIPQDAMTRKALDVAQSDPSNSEEVRRQLAAWFREGLKH